MLSSEIASLRAEAQPLIDRAAALINKANALEAALLALAPAAEPEPVVVEPLAEPVAEPVPEPEAPKVKKAPHAWALFFQRTCALLKAAGYKGTLMTVQPLWKKSHDWVDADIVPAWLLYKAEAEAEAEAEVVCVGGGAAEPPVKPKPVRKEMTPEQKAAAMAARMVKKEAKRRSALYLSPIERDGCQYLGNERGDLVSMEGEWVGRWTGSAIDASASAPADFDQFYTD